MKHIFLVFILCCLPVMAEEINLIPDPNFEEPMVNLNQRNNNKIMQSSSQTLKQGPIILQNSIVPVSGLQYKSNKIIYEDTEQTIEYPKQERE